MSRSKVEKSFNLENFRSPKAETIESAAADAVPQVKVMTPVRAAAIRKRFSGFTKVPLWWDQERYRFQRASTWRVALCVLHLHWRNGGRPFILSSLQLRARGVSRHEKARALRELESLGLITVEWRQKRNPRIVKVCGWCMARER